MRILQSNLLRLTNANNANNCFQFDIQTQGIGLIYTFLIPTSLEFKSYTKCSVT